jgi:hypothetical protein
MLDLRIISADISWFYQEARGLLKTVEGLVINEDENREALDLMLPFVAEKLIKSILLFDSCREVTKEVSYEHLKQELANSLSVFGHDLCSLLDEQPKLKDHLGVVSTCHVCNDFVNEVRVTYIHNQAERIAVFKDFVSVRYGSFSKHTDLARGFFPRQDAIHFLHLLNKEAEEKHKRVSNYLRTL